MNKNEAIAAVLASNGFSLADATELGRTEFHAGRPCTPCLSSAFMARYREFDATTKTNGLDTDGAYISLMRAFCTAWMAERAAA